MWCPMPIGWLNSKWRRGREGGRAALPRVESWRRRIVLVLKRMKNSSVLQGWPGRLSRDSNSKRKDFLVRNGGLSLTSARLKTVISISGIQKEPTRTKTSKSWPGSTASRLLQNLFDTITTINKWTEVLTAIRLEIRDKLFVIRHLGCEDAGEKAQIKKMLLWKKLIWATPKADF